MRADRDRENLLARDYNLKLGPHHRQSSPPPPSPLLRRPQVPVQHQPMLSINLPCILSSPLTWVKEDFPLSGRRCNETCQREVIGFSVRHKRRALRLAWPSTSTRVLGLTDVFGCISTREAIEFIEGRVIGVKTFKVKLRNVADFWNHSIQCKWGESSCSLIHANDLLN